MSDWIGLMVQVGSAGAVGGITNYLAIRMLFRPLHEKRWFGKRVPFTPGIVPARQPELAYAFGQLVQNELLTEDGIRNWLQTSGLRGQIVAFLQEQLVKASRSDESNQVKMADLIPKMIDQSALREQIGEWENGRRADWILFGLEKIKESDWLDRPLHSVFSLPDMSRVSSKIAEELLNWLQSDQARVALEQALRQLLGQLGGMFGMFAAMINPASLVDPLLNWLKQKAADESFQQAVAGRLEDVWTEWSKASVRDMLLQIWPHLNEGNDGLRKLAERLANSATLVELYDYLLQQRIPLNWLEQLLQKADHVIIERFWNEIPKWMAYLPLAKIVEHHVRELSVLQLEKMVLTLVGKEFRSITWFGVLLGALIGVLTWLI